MLLAQTGDGGYTHGVLNTTIGAQLGAVDLDIIILTTGIEQLEHCMHLILGIQFLQLGKGFGVHALLLGLFLYLPGKVVVHPVDIGHQLGYAVGNLHLN